MLALIFTFIKSYFQIQFNQQESKAGQHSLAEISKKENVKMAFEAGRIGGSMPTVFNAANEKAVALFLDRKIAYLQIADIIEECMLKHTTVKEPSLEEILEIEQKVYSYILSKYDK